MWRLLLVFPLLGCGSLDCEPVAARVLEDCGHAFGPGLEYCAHHDSESEDRLQRLATTFCELAKPSGSEDCYLEATCEALLDGSCDGWTIEPPPPEVCVNECVARAEECVRSCSSERDPDRCDACLIECNERLASCKAAC